MILTANKSGNFNTAGTWDSAITPGTIHASTNISITTTGKASTTFTAPNLVNYITGVWVYAVIYPASGRNWTAEVLLAGVPTGAIATIVQTDVPIGIGWVYFRLPTPLLFTSLVVGTYSWQFKSTTADSGSMGADNTSTTLVFPITTYDLNAAPTTADQIWIAPHNCTTAITVTVDGTTGDCRGGTSSGASPRTTGLGMYIGGGNAVDKAVLKWDTAASATLQIGGEICLQEGGTIEMGTVASPYPAGLVATFKQWIPTAAFYRIFVPNTTALATIKFSMVGAGPTSGFYATTLVSGVGTAASPLVVSDAVDWAVGDEICITPTSANATNYNETEYKFIKTKNSSTSYVLSATVGGAESAFTYTHNTNAKVLHMTRNVVYTSTNNLYGSITTGGSAAGNFAFKWAKFMNLGSSSVSGGGLATRATTGFLQAVDYCVFDACTQGHVASSNIAQTFTGNIGVRGRTSSNVTYVMQATAGTANQTFTDIYIVDSYREGFLNQAVGTILNNPTIIANSRGGTSTYGFNNAGGGSITINNPNIHCNNAAGMNLNSSPMVTVNGGYIGTKGINQTIDVRVATNTANNALFDSCTFGSATLLSNYLNGLSGATLIRFHRLNATDNKHRWYTELGSAWATGSGLTDTLVRTPASLNVRLSPEEATSGFSWSFLIPANKNNVVPFSGFFLKNVAMGTGDCTVSMFLPGNPVTGTPDATVTLSDDVSNTWVAPAIQAVSLSAYYTGTVDGFATIVINAKTTTSAAYLYCADFYNSGDTVTLLDKLAGLTIWHEGQPSPVITQLALGGVAASVWGVATSGLTVAGTTGTTLKKIDTIIGEVL